MTDDSGKILVVEDNAFVRMQIVKFISEETGFEVVEAEDGQDALDKDISGMVMMFVDVRMEPMGGFEFVRNLSSEDIRVPFVIITGDKSADILHQADKEGAAAVLMKPIEKDRLVMMVKRIAARRKRSDL